MVMNLNLQPHVCHGKTHGGAHILHRVDRGNREITPFYARAVPNIAFLIVTIGTPGRFFRFNFVRCSADVIRPTDRIENEELRFRTKVRCVPNARRFQISLAALSYRAGITVVTLHGGGFDHVAPE